MELSYLLTPFITWLVTGIIKFLVNTFKARKAAFNLIGYGGFPSNHSAIVSSMASLIAFKEGIYNPAFGVALTLAFIVFLDANSLRGQVGKHAIAINELNKKQGSNSNLLRERIGHSRIEILAGIIVGICVAYTLTNISLYF